MPEKFVDTLGEKVMVVITVDIISTFPKSPKIAGKYKSMCRDAFVCKQRVRTAHTRS